MYTPEGNEYRLLSSGTGLPNAPNYRQTTGGGSIVIDNIPAGDGYGIVVAVDDNGGPTFVPTHYAYRDSFAVAAGRETQLQLSLTAASELVTSLPGVNLNSVVGSVGTNAALFAASYTKVYQNPVSGSLQQAEYPLGPSGDIKTTSQTATFINSLSSAHAVDETVLVNTDIGVFPIVNGGSGYDVNTAYADTGYEAGVRNVVSSGLFQGPDAYVVYYQRRGGLGGAEFNDIGSGPNEWNDTGTELADFIGSDESPVWAAAVSDNAVFLSTVFGTFRATEALFSGTEIDIDALIGGDSSSTAGITFFGVAFPGTDRPLRIRHMGHIGNRVVVGTGRGAFFFGESAISTVGPNKLVAGVKAIPKTAGNYVVDMSVNDGWIAVLTPSRIVVVNEGTPGTLAYERPLRGYALGNPRDVFVVNGVGPVPRPVVYIAGSEGLSKIVF